ncbi:pyridoxal/pyridoxine/pyridoxamine kinase [Sphaerochaeta pleomorpha str. Grapes]|uniref:pyridoxal kinase n=1 Tax=Sphaerochaeta pleomorpha (strain ATCC BAA-1885 / DSM 22778 / Grapes) TaxID=158190 RepID=G8QVZ3_SPHPG|nr:pyridoxamine kinase [Sphaerochaeta pleomorpha]AEV30517.1 pyridoxal/pyridoxine/pyridoxamine kinase [Sphaerochaeta pleomorpha str. Grapes]
MVPSCVAIHDLCCYAKSSLTVVIPTLEALLVEACPLPTALLSSQTDGFDSYYCEDKTEAMEKVLAAWDSLGLSFDAIYSGFLGSFRQVRLVKNLIAREKLRHKTLVVVDPVLGDDGILYGPVDTELVDQMRSLICHGDVITPNTTEASLLLDKPYQTIFTEEEIFSWAQALHHLGPEYVVITSVRLHDTMAVAYCDRGRCALVPYQSVEATYPGSGDLFASILTALLLHKVGLQTAVEDAVSLCTLALQRTLQAGYQRRHGVAPLLIIDELVKKRKQHEC